MRIIIKGKKSLIILPNGKMKLIKTKTLNRLKKVGVI
jgi:DNA-binding Xre family transcriptional regulator